MAARQAFALLRPRVARVAQARPQARRVTPERAAAGVQRRPPCPADGRIPAICPGSGRKLDSRAWEIASLRVALRLLWSAASSHVYTWRTDMENTDLTLTILQNIRGDIAALGGRFGNLERRFDTLEGRFDNFEGRFDNLERRFDKLEGRFDSLERRFDKLEGRFDTLEGRFDTLEGTVAAMHKDMQAHLTRDEFRGAMLAMNIAQNERHERFEKRMNEIDTRSAAAHRELQDTLAPLIAQLGQHGSLAARITLCERDLADLRKRVL
jgi:predicted  nucleic acid-binding Zn-ribbon protein